MQICGLIKLADYDLFRMAYEKSGTVNIITKNSTF